MNTSTDDWRAKYLDSMRTLDNEEQRFRATEAILKRLVGRLCIACMGLSPRLDQEIKKLQTAVRREVVTSAELEQIMPSLSDAVVALDDKSPVVAAATVPPVQAQATVIVDKTIPNETQIRATLATLLAELKRDPSLVSDAESVDAQLTESLTTDRLSPILSSLTGIVGQRIQRIERARQEAEALLAQLVTRLDEITRLIADQNQNQNEVLASNETLNIQLSSEIKAMSASVESSSNLQQIRDFVKNKLEAINLHLHEFRQRETERASAMRARNEQMQKRMVELETEAQKLQTQLKEEQQVSLIDALTKMANRLAYDKRIVQELQRWQRFGHPVCIAVLDVDHFKRVNDTYGHRAGDRVLCSVADYLKNCARSTDFVARYGGEEFVMILTGTHISNALPLLEKIRIAIGKLGFHYSGAPVSITVSCGVTELKPDDSAESVFERADKALYQAKNGGRNQCISL